MEEELKLRVAEPGELERIAQAPEVTALAEGPERRVEMTADYIDTPDLRLLAAGYGYRVRWEGAGWVASVKADLGEAPGDGLHRHREWEIPVAGPDPDVEAFDDPRLREALVRARGDQPLVTLFRIEMTRRTRLLRLDQGSLAEWAVDRGRIRAGEREMAVCEVELERKEGPLEPIRELAEALQARYPLVPDPRTKFARGLELAGLAPPDPPPAPSG